MMGIIDGLAISRSFQFMLKELLSAWPQLSYSSARNVRRKPTSVKCQPYVSNSLY